MINAIPRISAATLARRLGPRPSTSSSAYRSLAWQIRDAVLDGRISIASGLPSERDLASRLELSRTTVAAAYSLLRDEGWLDSRRGSGSRVKLPDPPRSDESSGPIFGPAGAFGHRQPVRSGVIDLSTACLPAPADPLAAAVAAATDDLCALMGKDGYLPFGLPALRTAVAARYSMAGLPTRSEQILITNGAQHSFTLAVNELSLPGDRIMIECPTYPVALDALRAARRIPTPVGLADDPENAWDLTLFAATLRQSAPALGYFIPDFHNPTGALMDAGTRQQLVAEAKATNTMLLVDESFRDLSFVDSPDGTTTEMPPAMAGFDDGTCVISLGSVSKSFWGGLRIGWVRAAPPIIARLAAARALTDMGGSVLDQLIVVRLLQDPIQALAIQRERLRTGEATLSSELGLRLPDWRFHRPKGGACLWVKLPGPFAGELARLAPSVGVRIAPGPRFGPDGTMESYLRLPFTAGSADLVTAVTRLATIAEQAAGSRTSQIPGWLA